MRDRIGFVYAGTMDGVAVSAAQDLFELTAPSNRRVVIHRIEVGQDVSETSEVLPIKLVRGVGATAGSGGATVTPVRIKGGAAAATAALKRNNTTAMTAGSGALTTLARRDFNVVTGFLYEPNAQTAIELAPSEKLAVNLPTAPAGALTMSCEIIWEELL